jgi:hypothetical protein
MVPDPYEQVAGVGATTQAGSARVAAWCRRRDTQTERQRRGFVYGSEGWGFESLRAR